MALYHRQDPLEVLASGDQERALLTKVVRDMDSSAGDLRILEAGCGKSWPIDLTGVPHHLTGVDTDVEALRLRRETRGDLDEEIIADLREVDLPARSYDLIYCSYVLEHVAGAEQVMDHFVSALRPGGLLIIRIPDGHSVYGFVTRLTPHWVHIAFKRYVKGAPNAGKPGFGPYPTVYDSVISRQGMHDYAARRHLTVRHEYGTNHHLRVFGRFAKVVDLVLRGFAALSFGRLTATHNNIAVVLEKPRTA